LSIFNRYAGFNVANVVPGPETLVGVMKRRSRGIGLSGAYPVTGSLSVGMGFEAERDSITDIAANTATTKSLRSELAPFVLFDNTRGLGADTRGYRLSYSQAWNGSLFLKSLDSTRRSIKLTRYLDDPWTKGKNSFAFHLQGSWVRPRGSGPLLLERRYYPGDERVRGFSRGSLGPWVAVPGNSNLQAAGADTVLGVSTEYRVPIGDALSGAGFFDLGWTHLDPKDAAQLGSGARLIDATNGVLRASVGGELRLQLPIIRQPARMIFSWNPLRLNTVWPSPSSVLRLVEPKTSLRFALGSFY
jgi:outer membrane protein assembly factor BamA